MITYFYNPANSANLAGFHVALVHFYRGLKSCQGVAGFLDDSYEGIW